MPVWTLKTPQSGDPQELLRYLQELVQYLKYLTEYLDEKNVPMLRDLKLQLDEIDLTVAHVDNKYSMAFTDLEAWKTQIMAEIEALRGGLG